MSYGGYDGYGGGYGGPPGYSRAAPGYGGGFASPPQSHGPPHGADPQLWNWFSAVDTDRSGAITASELERALVNGDWTPFDLETVKLLMTLFDTDRNGTIGFNEFAGLWKYIKDWQNVFRHFDRDRSGSIDENELREALTQFGFNLSPQLIGLVQRKYDVKASQPTSFNPGISFDRFVRACVVIRQLTEAFGRLDTDRDGTEIDRLCMQIYVLPKLHWHRLCMQTFPTLQFRSSAISSDHCLNEVQFRMSLDGVFMCIAAALGPPSKSFEEVRVDDYILSYQTSGQPPPQVPQEPVDEIQRKALGLPPLFKPQTDISHASGSSGSNVASSSLLSSSSQNSSTKQKIMDSANIPLGQEFKVHIVATERYHNVVCMPEYEGFSPEELRCYAYLRGNVTSPVPITMDPFSASAEESSTIITPTATSDEKLQSQCALPEYNSHSPEELRVAWMIFERELTSKELLAVPSTPTAPSLGAASVPSSGIPPVVASSTLTPKFNFVFR